MPASVLLFCLGADMLQNTTQCSCGLGAMVSSLLMLFQREEMLEVTLSSVVQFIETQE